MLNGLWSLVKFFPTAGLSIDQKEKLEEFGRNVLEFGKNFLGKALIFAAIIVIGFWIIKKIEKKALKPRKSKVVDKTVQTFIISIVSVLLKVLVIAVACVVVMGDNGLIVAVIGSGGLAIGLALQGSLSNLAAGIIILTSKLFKVDDYIEYAGGGGTVLAIGLFYTKMKSPDGKGVYVPNSAITATTVTNFSDFEVRRVDIDFGVDYDTDIEKLKRVLYKVAEEHPMVLQDQNPMVTIVGYGDYAVDIKFRVFVNGADYWDFYFDIYTVIFLKFREEEISFPFPRYVIENMK